VKSVRDLGIYIDSDLVMRTHVKRTVSRCFAALRQLRQIRRSVPPATLQSLVITLVLSRQLPKRRTGLLSAVLRKRNASIKKCHKNAKINFTKAHNKCCVISSAPDTSVPSQGQRRLAGAVHHRAVQSIFVVWRVSDTTQVCIYHSTDEETRHGSGRL